ncbi:MAG: tyrosine--tRNA ligase [Chloroflexota bacterium]|nr:tyrosine--tRNA ligase [Chloroflexota bacterium]
MTVVTTNVLDTLSERGFVNQVSDMEGLRRVTEKPITLYCGFDPTSDSLHIGHLVQVMALAHFQQHGHRPIALVGGGTTMVGDPTGRATGRAIMTREAIAANAAKIKEQLSHYLDFSPGKAIMLDNAAWLTKLNYIDFLRDIGRHFSVNQMLAMETYKTRLETGLSFLEFNYLLLQSYDFLHMYREDGCILQIGGGDQWSNCLGGMDLIRKADGGEAFVMTTPLITDAAGQKMGKSTGNALSLNPAYMSPYDYYQFWINVEDSLVARFLAFFTFLPMDEVRRLTEHVGADLRPAKETLAFEATQLTHGEAAARAAQATSRALFSGEGARETAPTTVIPAADFAAGSAQGGISLADLFTRAGLATGRGDARRLAAQGGASLDGERVDDMDRTLTAADIPAEGVLLRAGKKRYQRVVTQ